VVEDLAGAEAVVVGEPSGQRVGEDLPLAPHPGPGQVGQGRGVALSGDQRFDHVPAGAAQDVAGHDRQLDPGVFEQLLQALLLPAPVAGQGGPPAGQVPQPADRRRRHEAGPHQPVRHQVTGPLGVDHVGLAAGHALHVPGVEQPALEPTLQQVEHRLPVGGG
jgi:hypothetical protein